jgi:hypothetical protein
VAHINGRSLYRGKETLGASLQTSVLKSGQYLVHFPYNCDEILSYCFEIILSEFIIKLSYFLLHNCENRVESKHFLCAENERA